MADKNTIIVKALAQGGRWRAGRQFTRAGVPINVNELTKAQLDAIRNDPQLVVVGAVPAAEDGGNAETAQDGAANANASDGTEDAKREEDRLQAVRKETDDALAREAKALAKPANRKTWEAAAAKALSDSGMSQEEFATLSDRDRILRIEQQLLAGG